MHPPAARVHYAFVLATRVHDASPVHTLDNVFVITTILVVAIVSLLASSLVSIPLKPVTDRKEEGVRVKFCFISRIGWTTQ